MSTSIKCSEAESAGVEKISDGFFLRTSYNCQEAFFSAMLQHIEMLRQKNGKR